MPRTPGQAGTQSQQPYLAAFAASTQRARSGIDVHKDMIKVAIRSRERR